MQTSRIHQDKNHREDVQGSSSFIITLAIGTRLKIFFFCKINYKLYLAFVFTLMPKTRNNRVKRLQHPSQFLDHLDLCIAMYFFSSHYHNYMNECREHHRNQMTNLHSHDGEKFKHNIVNSKQSRTELLSSFASSS